MGDPTRTGFDRLLGEVGQGYVNELARRGAAVLGEVHTAPDDGTGPTLTVSILRRRKVTAANTAAGKEAVWEDVAGLDAVPAVVFTPSTWKAAKARPEAFGALKEGERVILLIDVPADGKLPADRVTLQDRIRYADDVYGVHAFAVVDVSSHRAAGMLWVKAQYAREA